MKTNRTFSLNVEIVQQLKQYSKEKDIAMSAILEQAIKEFLGKVKAIENIK